MNTATRPSEPVPAAVAKLVNDAWQAGIGRSQLDVVQKLLVQAYQAGAAIGRADVHTHAIERRVDHG